MPSDHPVGRSALVATWLWGALSGAATAAPARHEPSKARIPHTLRPVLPQLRQRQRAQEQGPERGPERAHGEQGTHRPKGPPTPPVDLFAPNQGERLLFRPYDDKGRVRKNAQQELSHFLRCPHTGQEHPVDLRLLPVIYRMGRHFGKRVVIYSGYRPPQLSTRPLSRHRNGAAIDFQIPGVLNQDLVRWLRGEFHPLGIGFYPDGAHVHLDVDRQHDTYWVARGSDALPLGQLLARRRAAAHGGTKPAVHVVARKPPRRSPGKDDKG